MSSELLGTQLSVLVVVTTDQGAVEDLVRALGHEVLPLVSDMPLEEHCLTVGPVPGLVVTDTVDKEALERAVKAFRNRGLRVPFVLIAENGNVPALLACREVDTALEYCLKALDPDRMETAILWAVKEQELRDKIRTTEGLLDDQRAIDRATRLFIGGLKSMSEEKAYDRLQRCASSRDMKLADMARMVIDAFALFNPKKARPEKKEKKLKKKS